MRDPQYLCFECWVSKAVPCNLLGTETDDELAGPYTRHVPCAICGQPTRPMRVYNGPALVRDESKPLTNPIWDMFH